MNKDELPQTLLEAIRYFECANNCHAFFASMRWTDGKPVCPHCGSANIGKLSLPRRIWNCKGCKKQFSVKVGTIFEDSPLGLNKWLPAVWMIVNAKNGVSSCELARALGITQKSAWFLAHRIRAALHDGSFEKMSGHVEADETFIGAKARTMNAKQKAKRQAAFGKSTGPIAMAAVQGVLERSTREKISRVKLKVLKTTKKAEVQGNVREYVLKGSHVSTDALKSYAGLADEFVHGVVDHAVRYVEGNVHTNGLENFWSLLKRTVKGTYICPAPYHLFRYLDEQAYRFNERKDDDAGRFARAVSAVPNRRLKYAELTSKTNEVA